MALRQWSSEIYTAEFKELQANTFCCSRDGRLGLLAGRRSLGLLYMEQPKELMKKTSRNSRWEVGVGQWNPSQQYGEYVALTCNDKVEIYIWDNSDFSVSEPVRGHTRQVSDLHWNCKIPSVFASSSLDGNIHVWDIRDVRKPTQSFQTIVGASHIRWSRGDSWYLASAHEGDVKLWDARNDSSPVTYLSAHLSRVHSIDWSYTDSHSLVTASNDCTVKFHTVEGKVVDTLPSSLTTSVPVWRARYTPFGDGMVTVLVPHFGVQEHSLFLWNTKNLTTPVHTFVGHRDIILDFEWRRTGGGSLDHQMVTWSKDQSLRLWAPDQETQYRCGVEEDDLDSDSDSISGDSDGSAGVCDRATEALEEEEDGGLVLQVKSNRKKVEFADPSSLSGENKPGDNKHILEASPVKEYSPDSHSTVENTLQQEFALLDTNFTFLSVTDRDLEKRICRVVATTAHSRLLLLISFPPAYPVTVPPVFTFLKGSTMNTGARTRILRSLQETAQHQVKRNRACLERCLRQLEFQLDSINQDAVVEDEVTKNSFPFVRSTEYPGSGPEYYGAFQDTSIPYPRTSGSRFCSNGLLVCFGRPAYQIQVGAGADTGNTPRAYSAYLATVALKTDQDKCMSVLRPPCPRYPVSVLHSSIHTSSTASSYDGGQGWREEGGGREEGQGSVRRGRFKVKIVTTGAKEDGYLRSGTRSAAKRTQSRGHPKDVSVSLKVTVYNISPMLPISRELAAHYKVLDDPVAMCLHNSSVAANHGKTELSQIWKLAAQVATAAAQVGDSNELGPWSRCPMGKSLLSSLLQHTLQCRDFQTAALLICAFTEPTKSQPVSPVLSLGEQDPHPNKDKFWFLKYGALSSGPSLGDSPYHTVHSSGPAYTTLSGVHHKEHRIHSQGKLEDMFESPLSPRRKQKPGRSNSWTDATSEDTVIVESQGEKEGGEGEGVVGRGRWGLLEETQWGTYGKVVAAYTDTLYNWGLLEQRAGVCRHGPRRQQDVSRATVSTSCPTCETRVEKSACSLCRRRGLYCSICRLPVVGLGTVCPVCGHGGHLSHLSSWWSHHTTCPASCGCTCRLYL